MGLDSLYLVMEVEERFGISIRDEEAQNIIRVEDLYQLVISRVKARKLLACPSWTAFISVRNAVREVMDDAKLRIRPRQRIVDVVPSRLRHALWKNMRAQLGFSFPDLRRPYWMQVALLVASILLVQMAFLVITIDLKILPLSLLVAIACSFFLFMFTRPWCVMPPKTMSTFGDLTRNVMGVTVAQGESFAPDPP